jgi:hypothetical protein
MKISYAKCGFSVEWGYINPDRPGRYEKRENYNGLPCYEIIGGIITVIAIVEDPAISIKGVLDEENQIVYGPVMISDLRIYRTKKDECFVDDSEFYVYFSADTIRFLRDSYNGVVKINH